MKQLFVLLAMIAGTVVLAPAAVGQGQGKGLIKVAICHIPPGNPANAHVIIVGEPALAAHLAHGDVHLGTGLRADLVAEFGKAKTKCEVPTPPTTKPPTPPTTKPPAPPTTQPPTTTTTEAPHVVCPDATGNTFKTNPGPCPQFNEEVEEEVVVTIAGEQEEQPQTLQELPRTGLGSLPIAGFGSLLAGLGALLFGRRH